MNITLSKYAGFCPGVRHADNAIRKALALRKKDELICTLGPLIHNSIYVDSLRSQGVRIIDISNVENLVKSRHPAPTTVFIRTHGIESHIYSYLEKLSSTYSSLTTIDLTCPFVKNIHEIAMKETGKSTVFLLFCNPSHAESIGIMSYADGEKIAFSSLEEMEKSLNNFNVDLMKSQTKPFTANDRYEDPFRKSLQSKKGIIQPKPKTIYPEIDDNYKRTVMEKMSRLQIELRQIFDNITQIKETSGDDIKINEMINKAKELTGLISHLAKDIKHKEEEFKKGKKTKQSISPKKTNLNTTTTNKASTGDLNVSGSSKIFTSNHIQKGMLSTRQVKQQQRPVSATTKQAGNINVKQNASKTSPTFPTFKDNNKATSTTTTNMNVTSIPKPIDQRATYESIQKSTNFLRSTGFNPIIEESQDLRGTNSIQNNSSYINNNTSTIKSISGLYNNPSTFSINNFQTTNQF